MQKGLPNAKTSHCVVEESDDVHQFSAAAHRRKSSLNLS